MAWTTPRTWSPGETVTASLMNAHIRDNENVLKTPITDAGLIRAINGTYFSSLDGSLLTGCRATALKVDSATHTGSGTGETDATTYTLPAGTLATDGDVLIAEVWGKTAAGASSRTLKFWWNGASIITDVTAVASGNYRIFVIIQRTGATAQSAHCMIDRVATFNTATIAANTTLGTGWDNLNATLSGPVAVKTTVQDGTAGANITQEGFILYKIAAP